MTEPDNRELKHSHNGPADAGEPLDAAGQALSDALRVSFRILFVLMVGIVVVIILSGFFTVPASNVAIVTQFGRVKGVGADRLKTEGLHWKWPTPIDEVILIPAAASLRSLEVGNFWYYQTPEEKMGQRKTNPGQTLQFVRDGYSLTGAKSVATVTLNQEETVADYNIIHSYWEIRYNVVDPFRFVETLWDGSEAGWQQVHALLIATLSDAIIRSSAQNDIDWIVYDQPNLFKAQVKELFLDKLEALDTGIQIESLIFVEDPKPPLKVEAVFDMANSAGNQKQTRISQALAETNSILSQARSDKEAILANAQAYRNSIVEATSADATYLEELIAGIQQSIDQNMPDKEKTAERKVMFDQLLAVTVDELYHQTVREIFTRVDETMLLDTQEGASTQVRVKVNTNPNLKKEREDEQKMNAGQ
jgi:membrane protease subunit HflK